MALSEGDEVPLFYSIGALLVSILLLMASVYHNYKLHQMKKQNELARITKAIEKTKKALRCARWSAVEIAVLATHAGMTMDEIKQEYKRDASSRGEVLTSVLGSRKNYFVRKFVQHYPSRFLKSGYKLEKQFVKSAEREILHLRTALSYKEV